MEKTKVLLAFGTHSSRPRLAGKTDANVGFFKGAIAPFLEDQVVKQTKPCLVIFEGTDFNPRYSISEKNAFYERLYDAYSAGDEVLSGLFFDTRWGFEDKIIDINAKRPYSIICKFEPHGAEITLLSLEAHQLWEELSSRTYRGALLNGLAKYANLMGRASLARDSFIAEMALEFSQGNPGAVIVIPRGIAHRGMRCLFEPSFGGDFDIISREEESNPLDFNIALHDAFYRAALSGKIPEEMELMKLAISCMSAKRMS